MVPIRWCELRFCRRLTFPSVSVFRLVLFGSNLTDEPLYSAQEQPEGKPRDRGNGKEGKCLRGREANTIRRRLDRAFRPRPSLAYRDVQRMTVSLCSTFPRNDENTSTYAIKVLSRREIRETAQGSARDANLPTYLPAVARRDVLPFLELFGACTAIRKLRVTCRDPHQTRGFKRNGRRRRSVYGR